jgi:hypothetical protein
MGLAALSGSGFKELVHVESLLPFKDVIGSPADFMSKDRKGLGLAVFFLETFLELHSLGVTPEEKNGGFRESPLEMGVTDLFVGRTVPFSGGFPGALDESAVGGEILDSWEAAYVVDFIKNDERKDSPDAVDGF